MCNHSQAVTAQLRRRCPRAAALEGPLHTVLTPSKLTNDTFTPTQGPCCPAIAVCVDMAALGKLVRGAARVATAELPKWQLEIRRDA